MTNDNKIMNKEGKYVWGDNGNARIPTKEYKDNFDAIFNQTLGGRQEREMEEDRDGAEKDLMALEQAASTLKMQPKQVSVFLEELTTLCRLHNLMLLPQECEGFCTQLQLVRRDENFPTGSVEESCKDSDRSVSLDVGEEIYELYNW